MHPLLTSLNSAQRARNGLLALTCVALLSGCSIWPKSWTLSSDSEPAQAGMAAEADPKAQVSPSQFLETTPKASQQDVVVYPVVVPAQTESTPMAAMAPASPPPMQASAAMATKGAKGAKGTKGEKATKTAPAGGLEHAFYINVGLFAVPTNASSASQKLSDAQLPVFTEAVQTKKGKLTRVRVGPFSNRALAETAATKIHAMQLDAIVFEH